MLTTPKRKATNKTAAREEIERKFLDPYLTHFGGPGWDKESPCGNRDKNASVEIDFLKVTCRKCRIELKKYMH